MLPCDARKDPASLVWMFMTMVGARSRSTCRIGSAWSVGPAKRSKDAYTRLRGKLPDGKQLENVILGLPGAGAATHGAAPQPSAGNGATPGAAPPPGAGPGGTGSAPPTSGNLGGTTSPPHGSGTPQPGFAEGPAGNLFGNGGAGIFGGSGTASPKPRIRLEAPKPTSGLNLAGQLEMWSITPATPIQSVMRRA